MAATLPPPDLTRASEMASSAGGTNWWIPLLLVGLIAYGLLQRRAGRASVWRSRWATVAPLLSAVWSDLRYVASSPTRYIARRRTSRRFSEQLRAWDSTVDGPTDLDDLIRRMRDEGRP